MRSLERQLKYFRSVGHVCVYVRHLHIEYEAVKPKVTCIEAQILFDHSSFWWFYLINLSHHRLVVQNHFDCEISHRAFERARARDRTTKRSFTVWD